MIVKLIRRLLGLDLLQESTALAREQRKFIAELRQRHLEDIRAHRDLVAAWIISLESPEVDVREDLHRMLRELSDDVARLEEMVVA